MGPVNAAVKTGSGVLTSADGAPKVRTNSWKRQLVQCAMVAALACASYLVFSHFFLQSVRVVGVSMYPTLHDSESYLLNRWLYYFREPQPADIVVIRDPADHAFSVKRVIARSGDTVYFKNGSVYVNGMLLCEPYLAKGTPTFCTETREALFRCGKDQFFVLGDNRKNSSDSRAYGPIARRDILGMLVL